MKNKKSNNKPKQRQSPLNDPVFKTILLSIYTILNSALLIMNVSAEPNFLKIQLNKLALTSLSSLSSYFQFPSSYLSVHSDPLKMPQLSFKCRPPAMLQAPQDVNKAHSLH